MSDEVKDWMCGAKTRAGTPCRLAAMPNGRCKFHGGMSPAGVTHYKYGTGKTRRSKYLPDNLIGKYEEALADPELLSLREDIALTETRINELMELLATPGAAAAWGSVSAAFDDLRVAMNAKDVVEIQTALASLNSAIDEGAGYGVLWGQIFEVTEQRRKLVESEGKRLVAMQQMITNDRALLLISALLGILKAHITDTKVLNAIAIDIRELASREVS